MASLEADALLLGIWKNVSELEENISLVELESILNAARRREENQQKFAAALKGINLGSEDAVDKVEQAKKRVAAKLAGRSEESFGLDEFGIDFEEG